MYHSQSSVTTWVDRACAVTSIRLTELQRRRLIAALLSRRNLILSGPFGIGKCQLAHALALSITQGRESRVCLLQGHPWWAARTGNVGRFVQLQTEFSAWRLAYFTESALHGEQPLSRVQADGDAGDYVAWVARMSPVEIDLYFRVVTEWLIRSAGGNARSMPIRLIGTYDTNTPPHLDDQILRATALVHLSNAR